MTSLDVLNKQLQDLPNWGKAAVAGGLALALYIPYKWLTTAPRKSPVKQDWKSGIVYLYQFPRTRILPSPSAPCLKVETWLRMAEIQYENIPCFISVRSREGTLPFVEFEGVEYPDSSFIIRDLTQILGVKLEDHLNDEQKAVSRAFEELAHNSLLVSHKLFRLEHVSEVHNTVFKQIRIGSDDIRAISKYLGSKHYFTGFKPTRVGYPSYSTIYARVLKNEF
uniref:Thioredoxin-like_fold domain-containing protein n=1 Tax=Angiostrongylus cantonensis TaxID=6313 RepID=A0A0K0DGL1_ANGCA